MKRAWLALRVAAVTFAIALPVGAAAPADQYEFFTSNDVAITDHYTKLLWERPTTDATYTPMSFAAAQSYCAGLNLGGNAMRLPSLRELLTIVDEEPHAFYTDGKNEPRYIDKNAFHDPPSGQQFWTSSLVPGASSPTAYTVDFTTGAVDVGHLGDTRVVRCVDYEP